MEGLLWPEGHGEVVVGVRGTEHWRSLLHCSPGHRITGSPSDVPAAGQTQGGTRYTMAVVLP